MLDDSADNDSCYRDFYLQLVQAEAALEKELVTKWTSALKDSTDGWKGIKDFLEKRFRDDWGKNIQEVHTSAVDVRKTPEFKSLIALLEDKLTPEQKQELSKMLDEMGDDEE